MPRGQTLGIRLHGGDTLAKITRPGCVYGAFGAKCHRKSLKDVKSQRVLEQFKFSCTVFRYGMHEYISYRIKTAGCRRS